ncbi:restriction endonuclease subunit S [Leeuwenhoekiella palythoae]|uniref:restriction endonuclease subunit S n=1 Tax=Leeuwenhoekiella palythoae TaxID=573501 RepID=UPI001CE13C9B|nr:restriction endonuclease subunit S [Leeuwenhoekiella palythoae]UBZ08952.1 restriction endonuclease subunit S [Leeuwenhoekiella palythoae]
MKYLKQYPEYFDSEVEWLRMVPTHWEIVKAKRIFVETSIKGFPNEELLAATQSKGVIPKSLYENTTVTATKNFESLKLVEKGDFVISLRSFQGGIEYAHYRGIISTAYTILKPQEEVVHKYFRYLLKSKRYISGLTLLVTGIREGQNIDTSKFKDSYLPLPPKQEQTTIANFLDYKTEKINRFIKKKKQLIKLLNEQKAAIINKAVTKGINPNVPMKDSGIEWLGEMPEHWEIRKIKSILQKSKGSIKPGPFGSDLKNTDIKKEGFKVYNQRAVLDEDYIQIKDCVNENKFNALNSFHVAEGDILLTSRGTIGRCSIVPKNHLAGVIHPCIIRLRIDSGIVIHNFVKLFIEQSKAFQTSLKINSNATTIDVIYGNTLKGVVFLTPSIPEQKKIVNFIYTETQTIDQTISTINKEITLVEEYKTALIAEAVTGKIDVRDFKVSSEEMPLAMVAEEAANYNKTV